MSEIKIEFNYQWEPAVRDENGNNYFFPEEITPFMRQKYRHPAIYRWNIFSESLKDEKFYIGEAQDLCQRINGYLNPGPSQQTNKRINKKFHEYIENGFKIRLEILRFEKIRINDFVITENDLSHKHNRRFIEELMVIIYEQKGFQLLNL
jgi:hypothetical protein